MILDGNVKRVLARHRAVPGWPGTTAVARELWEIADTLTPDKRIPDYTQAIMDLGATLCTRSRPACAACPVADDCIARRQDNPEAYPGKKPKKTLPVRTALFLVIDNGRGEVLLARRPPSGIWGGLWSFPEAQSKDEISTVCTHHGLIPKSVSLGSPRRHTFSHFHLDFTPVHIRAEAKGRKISESASSRWVNPDRPGAIGLPAPVKKVLDEDLKTLS